MTAPLVVLAFFSVVVAWGWPVWDASASQLEHTLHHAQHHGVKADFGHVVTGEHAEQFPEAAAKPERQNVREQAHKLHDQAGLMALGVVLLGIVFAMATYFYRALDPAEGKEQFPKVHAFLVNKWYFDAVYSVLLVRPAMIVARAFRAFDLKVIDGLLHGVARGTVRASKADGKFDNGFIDGLVNLVGRVTHAAGASLRNLQTGYLRSYVLFLVLGAVAAFLLLSYFVAMAAPG
jgi:NADH-quinone oxidoreductase subunit L